MLKVIDNKIENLARSLQKRNNLDHIEYLKMRLGMQVFVNNFFKTVVIYGVSILCHLFLYTLTVHLSFFIIRHFAHGAHARISLICYLESLIYFILLPCLIGYIQISSLVMYPLVVIVLFIIIKSDPSITKKQPIPDRQEKVRR